MPSIDRSTTSRSVHGPALSRRRALAGLALAPLAAIGAAPASALTPAERTGFALRHSFADGADPSFGGTGPAAGLVRASDGLFYGTAENGGAFSRGTLYRTDGLGAVTVVRAFDADSRGYGPRGRLVQAADGRLCGTTRAGGANDAGTVFATTLDGRMRTLHAFDGSDGRAPVAGLVEAPDGRLYGTTPSGGLGAGTLFRVGLDGGFELLHAFALVGSDGRLPRAALTVGRDGLLYGSTSAGGPSNLGTVFRATLDGTITTLHAFRGGDGAWPAAALVQGRDGWFYGSTMNGGGGGVGTLFRISRRGEFESLHAFRIDEPGGVAPTAELLQVDGGGFYGASGGGGGEAGDAWLFGWSALRGFQPLRAFGASPVTGGSWSPQGGLAAHDGALLGTTAQGGLFGVGSIYALYDLRHPPAADIR